MIFTEIPLGDKAADEEGENRGVDADEQPAHIPEDDGGVHVAEKLDLSKLVHEVEWDRNEEAE